VDLMLGWCLQGNYNLSLQGFAGAIAAAWLVDGTSTFTQVGAAYRSLHMQKQGITCNSISGMQPLIKAAVASQ
jgi:hypothetical protein